MRVKLTAILIALILVLGLVAGVSAAILLCVSNEQLKGQETVGSCLAKGERFAVVDQFGLVRILTPEEVALTKVLNPKVFETRAFGMKYIQLAPPLPPLPVSPEIPGG
ncbi:MAG: succinylglutamate desuccinylase [Desulfobaccales bacterium]